MIGLHTQNVGGPNITLTRRAQKQGYGMPECSLKDRNKQAGGTKGCRAKVAETQGAHAAASDAAATPLRAAVGQYFVAR